jgi:hypothetical protein
VTRLSSSAIEHSHVLAAIADYDRRGPADFLRHRRFGEARSVFLLHDGRHYEAKAIVGVANGYATGTFITGGDPDYKAGQARSVLRRLGMTVTDQIPSTTAPPVEVPQIRSIPLEQSITESYSVQTPLESESVRERSEAQLVGAYAAYLRSQGHTVYRHTIAVEGEVLATDIFDDTTGELTEAKSSADRGVIRLALGQVLDYARYVQPDSMAVLVPRRPSADLCALLTTNHVNVIWPEGGGFGRDDGPDARTAR